MLNVGVEAISGWQVTHEALTRLARSRAGLDFEEGQQFRTAERAKVHVRLGYGSFVEYIERLFGYAPRLTLEKLRVAQALESLPELARALRDGAASWSSLRELTRVATRETEHAWLEAAQGRTVREVEKLVSGHRPGDLPHDPKVPGGERHVLRFEVSGDVLATFREAMAKLRRESGGPLDDDAALLLMARQVLAGPSDDGRASYQVAVTVCESCGRATQVGRGEPVDIPAEVVAMARCDAQELTRAHVGEVAKAHQTVPPAVRREVLQRDRHCCQVPGCRQATFVDVHHLRAREDGGGHELDNLLTLCGAHHRACHRGQLTIEGLVSSGLVFRHADGTPYGLPPSPGEVDIRARAYRALRVLGFGESEVRAALRQTEDRSGQSDDQTHVGYGARLEGVIRGALALLTENAWAKAS